MKKQGIYMVFNDWLDADRRLDEEGLRQKVVDTAIARYEDRRAQMGEESAAQLERYFMLQSLDRHWKEHLTQMDQLRKGIHLRSYAQKNPEQEYKRESFELFQSMLGAIKSDVVQDLARIHVPTPEELAALEEERRLQVEQMRMQFEHEAAGGSDETAHNTPNERQSVFAQNITFTRTPNAIDEAQAERMADEDVIIPPNLNRNAPCPCGSGLKYKQCHGKIS